MHNVCSWVTDVLSPNRQSSPPALRGHHERFYCYWRHHYGENEPAETPFPTRITQIGTQQQGMRAKYLLHVEFSSASPHRVEGDGVVPDERVRRAGVAEPGSLLTGAKRPHTHTKPSSKHWRQRTAADATLVDASSIVSCFASQCVHISTKT